MKCKENAVGKKSAQILTRIRQWIFFSCYFRFKGGAWEGGGSVGGRRKEDRKTDVRKEGKKGKGGTSELIFNTN